MVGGLVEEDQVRLRGELGGEAEAAAFAATQSGDGAPERLLRIETQPLQHGVDPGVEVVSPFPLEPFLVAAISLEISLGQGRTEERQAFSLLRERVLERREWREGDRRRFPHGPGVAEIAVLVEQRELEAWAPGHDPGRRGRITGQQAEQGGLPRPVPADDAPALSGRDGPGNIAEHRGGPVFDRHAGEGEERHGQKDNAPPGLLLSSLPLSLSRFRHLPIWWFAKLQGKA